MPQIFADPTAPARVETQSLPWIPSPMPGVDRRMIERDGDEVARVTSVVRYAPGSRFSPHTHSGGEEFLVLDGVFSDEHRDYPTGTYVRNPVGTRHQPHVVPGCTIFVKLWWMHPEDQTPARVDTTDARLWVEASWGRRLLLHQFGAESVEMIDLRPGAVLPARETPGGEEIFIVRGSAVDAVEGTWIRRPEDAQPAFTAGPEGCQCYIRRGFLVHLPPHPIG
ncbi:MAG: cupin domain-containing protein [Myxococcota bacterium]